MANVKDKVVTTESLSVLHEHNKKTYMPMTDPTCTGTMTMDGDAIFFGDVYASSIIIGASVKLVPNTDRIEIVFLDNITDLDGVIEES